MNIRLFHTTNELIDISQRLNVLSSNISKYKYTYIHTHISTYNVYNTLCNELVVAKKYVRCKCDYLFYNLMQT